MIKSTITFLLIIFLFICCSTSNQNQNETQSENGQQKIDALSIITTIITTKPKAYAVSDDNNKIIFLNEEKGEWSNSSLYLTALEKINNNWIQISKRKIGNEDMVDLHSDTIKSVVINNTNYSFFIADGFYQGTAYNGLNRNHFIFYNMESDSLIDVTYILQAGDAVGNYEISNSTISKNKELLGYVTNCVNTIYGKQNLDLNSVDNFHLKWLSLNPEIYNRVKDNLNSQSWIDVNFPSFNKDFFYSRIDKDPNNPKIIDSSKYIAYAGFVNPVLVYNKEVQKCFVLWIPEGWPSGGAWGIRSFEIDSISDDLIFASDGSISIDFDVAHNKLRARKHD